MIKDEIKNALSKAEKLISLWDFQRSIDILNWVLVKDLDNLEAYHLKGLSLIQLWKFEDAKINFDRIISIDSTNKEALREMAWIYSELKDFDKAIEFANFALSNWENSEVTYSILLTSYSSLNQLNNFEKTLKEAMVNYSNSADFLFSLWLIYSEFDYKKSIKHLKNAYKIKDFDKKLDYYLAIAYKNTGKHKEAMVHLDIAINQNPHFLDAYVLKFEILYITWDDNLINSFLEKALIVFPWNDFFSFYYAKTLISLWENEKSLACISKIVDNSPNPQVIELYLVALFVNQKYKEVIEYIENNFIWSEVLYHRILAESYINLDEYELALVILLEAKNKKLYSQEDIYTDIVNCYSHLWDFDLIEDLLNEAMIVLPDNSIILKLFFKYYFEASKYEEALSFYAKHKDILEQDEKILYNLAEIYLLQDKFDKVTQVISYWLVKFPKFTDFYIIKATSLIKLGKDKDAINELNNALKLEPDNLYVLNYLYKINLENFLYSEALDVLEKIIQVSSKTEKLLNEKIVLNLKLDEYEYAKSLISDLLKDDFKLNHEALALFISLSKKLDKLDDLENIISLYEENYHLDNDSVYLLALVKWEVLWKPAIAINLLEKNFSNVDTEVNYYILMISLYIELWYQNKALELCDLWMEVFPTEAEIYLQKVKLLFWKGEKSDDILKLINYWIEYSWKNTQIKAELYLYKSTFYLDLWENNHALSILNKWVCECPNNISLKSILATTLDSKFNNYSDAILITQEVLNADFTFRTFDYLIELLLKDKRKNEAIDVILKNELRLSKGQKNILLKKINKF